MSKQFWGVIIAIVVIFVAIFAFSGDKSGNSSKGSSNKSSLTQHIEGNGTTGVTLVEYGDYQCPFCGQYYPTVKQVVAQYNDKIHFQFRNFPLTNNHPNAFAAARAAEAAAAQNKFWEMHDVLYETQSQWSSASDPTKFFNQYATQIGLNLDQFKKDSASSKVNDAINADMGEGNNLQVNATPTFYIDGKKIDVNNSAADFQKKLDEAIAKKSAAKPTP